MFDTNITDVTLIFVTTYKRIMDKLYYMITHILQVLSPWFNYNYFGIPIFIQSLFRTDLMPTRLK